MKTNYTTEMQRHNVTPSQFLTYVRRRLKATGGDAFCGCLDLDYFAAGSEPNYDTERDGAHCISRSKPYDMQTYISEGGRLYNEICEFEFDDEKTGHGYYYLIDAEADETTETTPAAEPETGTAETAERAESPEIIARMAEIIATTPARSAWARGVRAYAAELCGSLRGAAAYAAETGTPSPLADRETVRAALLNGARDWSEYSCGGCALIYDGDIAARMCTPSELRRTHGGQCDPNPRERWLDVQARALCQAGAAVLAAYDKTAREGARA